MSFSSIWAIWLDSLSWFSGFPWSGRELLHFWVYHPRLIVSLFKFSLGTFVRFEQYYWSDFLRSCTSLKRPHWLIIQDLLIRLRNLILNIELFEWSSIILFIFFTHFKKYYWIALSDELYPFSSVLIFLYFGPILSFVNLSKLREISLISENLPKKRLLEPNWYSASFLFWHSVMAIFLSQSSQFPYLTSISSNFSGLQLRIRFSSKLVLSLCPALALSTDNCFWSEVPSISRRNYAFEISWDIQI